MKKTNIGLVKYVEQAHKEKFGYVWGTFGQLLTEPLLKQKIKQYPNGVANHQTFIRNTWLGRKTADCVGLIKGFYWMNETTKRIEYKSNTDVNADGMYQRATKKGPINTIPDVPGICVWHKGHIGVYIGNGWVIEARGTKYGVKKYKLKDRVFTHWLECPYISYEKKVIAKPTPKPIEPSKPKVIMKTGDIRIEHRGKVIPLKGIHETLEGVSGLTQYIAIRDMEVLGYDVIWTPGSIMLDKVEEFRKFNLNMDYIIDSLTKANVKVTNGNKTVTLEGFKVVESYGGVTQFVAIRDLEKLGFKVTWDGKNRRVVLE